MNNSSFLLSSRPAAFSSAAAVLPPYDAISTSSSTLVNPDLDEYTIRRRRQQLLPATTSSRQPNDKMKRGLLNSDGWLKSEARFTPSIEKKKEYPDDHRCSDQETASGLCGCTLDASPDSGSASSSSPVIASDQDNNGARESCYNYDQQLLAARKRKLMMERKKPQTLEDVTVMRASPGAGQQDSTAERFSSTGHLTSKPSRNLSSDPVLVSRPGFIGTPISAFDQDNRDNLSSSSENEQWRSKGPTLNRRWNSSPVKSASQSQSRPLAANRSFTGKLSNSFELPSKIDRSKEAATSAPPSAARKSINSVFEKLLKEEEQRREEDRAKKEAARERRREMKRRKDTEWPSSKEEKQEVSSSVVGSSGLEPDVEPTIRASERGLEEESKVMSLFSEVDFSSPSKQAKLKSDRLNRLSRTLSQNETEQRLVPKPSPEKPSAESYKARLSALRSASMSMESDKDGDVSRMSQTRNLLSYQALTPDSSMLDVNGSLLSNSIRARLLSANEYSQSEDSHEVEERDNEEDHVTIGSDFQGQAPLQSTPPRNSSSTKYRSFTASPLQTRKAKETSHIKDPLRNILQDLTVVLNDLRDAKAEPAEKIECSVLELNGAQEIEQSGKLVHQPSFADVEERRKQRTETDQAYVEKIGKIRKQLQGFKTKASTATDRTEKSTRWSKTRNLIITFSIQLLFAYLMITAAEMRARQLFMTEYYDPFLPHDFMDLSQTSVGNLFATLIRRWKVFLTGELTLEDNMTLVDQSWRGCLGWILNQVFLGKDKSKATKLLLLNVLGLNDGDVFQIASFAPT